MHIEVEFFSQVKHDTCRAQLLEERELVASAIGSIVNSPLDKDTVCLMFTPVDMWRNLE